MSAPPPSKKTKRDEETDKTATEPKVWFLLLITQEEELPTAYRVPLETESVKTIKAAARACAEIEKQWDYPMASCALSTAINGILGAYLWCEDSEEADKGIVRISSVYKSGFGSGFAEKDDDAATIIDLSKLIQERAKWQKVYIDCRPINNFMDESPDLYQIVTIDGWC